MRSNDATPSRLSLKAIPAFVALLCVALLACPAGAQAQTTTPTRLVRADVAVSAGWFGARHPGQAGCCAWSTGLFKGLQGGYYWTDHLKTELEVAGTGETEAYAYSSSGSGASAVYVSDRHSYRDVIVSGAQAYQFGWNAWFHAFVGAGLDVDRERETVERMTYTTSSQVVALPTATHLRTRPFVMAGFKAYVSERVFFRSDLKMGYRTGVDQITWRLGLGVDF